MSSVESEYGRLLGYLREQDLPDDARRLANLIGANLQALAEVGATRRARSSRLVPLAQQHLEGASAEIAAQEVMAQAQADQSRLHALTVGPFRGFMSQETFDLSHDITLIYGPNGTGKSSFCEALETTMLGSVGEARAKRLDHRAYCTNARLRRYAPPRLSTRTATGVIGEMGANEDVYRFCFVEKNRLDDFARIAARTPGDQRQLIATLFGIDQFSEFVRGFNPLLDESLLLVGPKATELKAARDKLATSEALVKGYATRIEAQQKDETVLAETINPGAGFEAACTWLLGTQDTQGALAAIQAKLDAAQTSVLGFTSERLTQMRSSHDTAKENLSEVSRKLADRAGEVSFAQLFDAVLALAEGAEACPACGTDLTEVRINPFERARKGLEELAELATLQRQKTEHQATLDEASRTLRAEMALVVGALGKAKEQELAVANLPFLPEGRAGDWLDAWTGGDKPAWSTLMTLVALLEAQDATSREVQAQREALVAKRNRLDGLRGGVERHRATAEVHKKDYDDAQTTISQFDEANRELIAAVEKEKPAIALNWRIKAAYDDFLPKLQAYLAVLPGQLIQGLGGRARDLYNAFNRGDRENDNLAELRLPVAENGKIEIEFIGAPGRGYDALVVLSEGHLRCLGLAILLAKNIEQRCAVVIFDDVVNAIDDEHRDGIWRTFFEDRWLAGKQVILTSHAEEFLLRIQQELGVARNGAIKRYKFLPHAGEHELRVDTDPATKNYVLLASRALAQVCQIPTQFE